MLLSELKSLLLKVILIIKALCTPLTLTTENRLLGGIVDCYMDIYHLSLVEFLGASWQGINIHILVLLRLFRCRIFCTMDTQLSID